MARGVRRADIDLVIGNAGQANQLMINDGSGHFAEDTGSAIATGTGYTNALAAADVDGDGGAWDAHSAHGG